VRTSAFAAALLLGLAIRLAALPLPGTETVETLKIWSVAGSGDVSTVYGSEGVPAPVVRWQGHAARVDGLPAALYELGLVGRLYRAYDPSFQDGRWLGLLIKLPGLLAGAILTLLLYSVVRQRTGREALARWAALACWLNPALVLDGDALGSLDPLVHLPAMAALLLVHVEAPFAAGLMAAVAVLTDAQGLLVLPALVVALVALRGSGGVLRAIAGMAIAAGVLLLPFMNGGALRAMWVACGLPAWLEQSESIDAANLWLLGGWALGVLPFLKGEGIAALLRSPVRRPSVLDRIRHLRVPHPRLLSAAAAAVFIVRACWQTRESRSVALHAMVAAFTVQSYFLLTAGAPLALAAARITRFDDLAWLAVALLAADLATWWLRERRRPRETATSSPAAT